MKRKNFLLTTLSLTTLPAIVSSQHNQPSPESNPGFRIAAGEGKLHGHITLKGVNSNVLDLKISGNDNNGAFALFEQISRSPGRGTPLHVHHKQHEAFYVLEGKYYFQVGDEKFYMGPGDTVFLPMGIPHAWTQVSEKGRMNVLFQPAGKMENFFLTVAALQQEPTKDEMSQIFAVNEMQVVGPPLVVPE